MRALPLLLLLLAPAFASAQQPDSACTYQQCALHVERTLLGYRVVRGEPGVEVGASGAATLGAPSARFDLAEAVAASPTALAHAHRYERQRRATAVVSTGARVGALLMVGSIVLGSRYDRAGQVGAWSWLGLTALSLPLNHRARRSFNRSIAAYNAALPGAQ